MKILYVALKYDYGIPKRGYSFEHYNFYDTLVRMGYEIEHFDFYPLYQTYGREKMTRMLREKVEEFQPDLMFTFLFANEFDPVQLKRIKTETKTITFNWFADDHWRFDHFSRIWAHCFTFVSTTDPKAIKKYQALGYRNVLLTQWGANTKLYTKGNVHKKEDVTFVGQAYGMRYNIIHKLIKEEISVNVWGSNWNLKIWHRVARKIHFLSNESFQKIADSTRISQETMIKIFQRSRINMNLSGASQKERNQIKGRNFEIPACGGFQLSEYVDGLENYFKIDREIVCYRNQSELIDKIKYYLSHDQEREAIAEAGYQRVLQEHTYQKRFNELFKKMQLL